MTAVAVLDAERIKFTTAQSSMWVSLVVAVLSLVLAALQGALSYASAPLDPQRAVLGVAVFGVPVLMVLASMTVTSEYRSGMIRTTFIATPNRTLVVLAKVVVTALFSAVFAAVLTVSAIALAGVLATGGVAVDQSSRQWRLAMAIALYAALAAALGVGVGALLRAGPGAVAVLLLWPLVVEPMLGNLPDLGPQVGPYLPFANVLRFVDVTWLYPAYAMPWGAVGSLAYFAAWTVAVLGAAIAVVNIRDA